MTTKKSTPKTARQAGFLAHHHLSAAPSFATISICKIRKVNMRILPLLAFLVLVSGPVLAQSPKSTPASAAALSPAAVTPAVKLFLAPFASGYEKPVQIVTAPNG